MDKKLDKEVVEKETIIDEIVKESKKPVKKKKVKGNIPFGADLADIVIGGSIPYGIMNIVGDSSSGKSYISGEIVAKAFHVLDRNMDWFYDDVEKGYRFNTSKLYRYGEGKKDFVDVLNGGFFTQEKRSHTIEDFERNIQNVIAKKEKDKPFIYILDSFDAITTDDELLFRKKKFSTRKSSNTDKAEKKDKGSYNLSKQKENHAFFRTSIREIEENNILLIVVSQVKENISVMFGAKYYRTGGKSLDFYPNVVLWLAEAERYTKLGRTIGICVKILGTKTRNDKPFRSCFIDLLFDYGIDNISSNLKFLYDLKTDRGKDNKVSEKEILWDDLSFLLENLIAYIEDNNLEDELKKRTLQKWDGIELEISSNNRKRKW